VKVSLIGHKISKSMR